jgi:hypothetical protein
MSIKEIESAIEQLPAKEVAELMDWLAEYHAQVWDRQIEDDVNTGRLDALLDEVDRECDAGHVRRFCKLTSVEMTPP